MSRSTMKYRCSLCMAKCKEKDLTPIDSMQLCRDCYFEYEKGAYQQRVMLLNSIKCYRRLVAKYEDNGNIILDTSFEGIAPKDKK